MPIAPSVTIAPRGGITRILQLGHLGVYATTRGVGFKVDVSGAGVLKVRISRDVGHKSNTSRDVGWHRA